MYGIHLSGYRIDCPQERQTGINRSKNLIVARFAVNEFVSDVQEQFEGTGDMLWQAPLRA
jgi:hypothetical protein